MLIYLSFIFSYVRMIKYEKLCYFFNFIVRPLPWDLILIKVELNSKMPHNIVKKIITLHLNDRFHFLFWVCFCFFYLLGYKISLFVLLFVVKFVVEGNNRISSLVLELFVRVIDMIPKFLTKDCSIIESIRNKGLNLFFYRTIKVL